MAGWAFNRAAQVNAPARLENGAVDYQKNADDQQASHAVHVCAFSSSSSTKSSKLKQLPNYRALVLCQLLLAGEVIHSDRILEQRIVSGDYGDAAFGDEVTLAVGLGVVADGGALGNMHVAVEDRLANAATAADADMREQDAVVHLGVGVDAHVGGEDGVL